MWSSLLLISMLGVIWCPITSAAPGRYKTDKIVCYHGTSSHWRSGNGKFVISDIDTDLCTHINYAFLGINSNGTIRLSSDDLGFLIEYGKLKNRTPKPKLLISIGGWSEGSTTFSTVARSTSLRKKLLDSAITLIQMYNFDGFDFDWEYPGQRGGGSDDKRNFVTLLEEFRAEFNKRGYLLTAAVAATTSYYDVPGIAKSLDFINVRLTTLLHQGIQPQGITHLTPIPSIYTWLSFGATYNKLVLGVGTYGRTFTLRDPNNNGVGAPVSGGGSPGPYTQESGYLGYNEICEKLRSGWCRKWSSQLEVPYAHGGNQWVGYDDFDSIAIKGKFVVKCNLAGIMIWSVETDDFRGICGAKYPLLNAVKSALKVPSTGTTTTPKPYDNIICNAEGYIRDASDCSKYYYCQWTGCYYVVYSFQCGSGLYYDTKLGVCNWRDQVSCP